ncbi:MAG: ribosomal protein L3 [Parcubacteria bacterium C7867-001]|nr:MAG: ribosomal protein L3 [Parcubacteria bacterium C7867-001]
MKFILARKDRMTQIFDEKGVVHAGTVLKADPSVVTQVKTVDGKDGYAAVQIGFDKQTEKRLAKAQHSKAFKVLKEFRIDNVADYTVGGEAGVDTFAVGEAVRVSGTSKGRGFAGVVKRYNFKGGRRSHGQKHSERERGSSGGGPGRAGGRVALGMRMAGRMGSERVTVDGLKVLHVDAKAGEIIISGAIPGARGSLVEVVSAPLGQGKKK